MSKATSLLAKISAIIMIVVGAIGAVSNIYMIIAGAFVFQFVLGALGLLVSGILLLGASKAIDTTKFLVMVIIALVFVILDRFVLDSWAVNGSILAIISVEFYAIFARILSIVMIIVMIAVIAALALKIVAMCKK